MYAELSLEHEVVKEALEKKVVGPVQRRQLAHWIVQVKAFSKQRACRIAGLSRRMFAYQSKRQPDTKVEQAIQVLANRHPGWGFWRPSHGSFIIDYAVKDTLTIISVFGEFTAN